MLFLNDPYGSAKKLLGVLFVKWPAFSGLLRTSYTMLFLNDPYGSAKKLLGVLFVKWPVFSGLLRTSYTMLFLNDPYGAMEAQMLDSMVNSSIFSTSTVS